MRKTSQTRWAAILWQGDDCSWKTRGPVYAAVDAGQASAVGRCPGGPLVIVTVVHSVQTSFAFGTNQEADEMFEEERGPEGRTGPPANGSYCLTLLSEPTRKQALFQPSNLQKRALSGRHKHSKTAPSPVSKRTVLKDGPGLRATAPSQSSSNALPLLAAGVGGLYIYITARCFL